MMRERTCDEWGTLLMYPMTNLEHRLVQLLSSGALTRDQMVKMLDIPRTTVYDALKRLIQRGKVLKYPSEKVDHGKGRPLVMFALIDYEEGKNDEW